MRRGQIWWAEQPKPIGRRPVVLLSRNEAYRVRNAVTVAQVSRTIRNIPVEVFLGKAEGLNCKCVVNLDTISTIRKSCLIEPITILSPDKIKEINKAIKFALSLE